VKRHQSAYSYITQYSMTGGLLNTRSILTANPLPPRPL